MWIEKIYFFSKSFFKIIPGTGNISKFFFFKFRIKINIAIFTCSIFCIRTKKAYGDKTVFFFKFILMCF